MKMVSAGWVTEMRALALRGCGDRRQTGVGGVAMLQAEERGVAAAAPQQVVMLAALDDLAALDHQNGVGVHDGVQAVGDDNGGAGPAEMLDRFLHGLFGFRIPRRGPLNGPDDRRVLDQRHRRLARPSPPPVHTDPRLRAPALRTATT